MGIVCRKVAVNGRRRGDNKDKECDSQDAVATNWIRTPRSVFRDTEGDENQSENAARG